MNNQLCGVCKEAEAPELHLCPLLARFDSIRYRDFPCNCCKTCQANCANSSDLNLETVKTFEKKLIKLERTRLS